MAVSYDEKSPLNTANDPAGARVFAVRYGPESAGSLREPWPNNIGLSGSGTLTVTDDAAIFSDGRDAAADTRRRFSLSDIANVRHGQNDSGFIVAVRTRSDDREVHVWLASKEDTDALLALLPGTTTPEFLAHLEQHRKFRENLAALAPHAPVTPVIIGINIAVFVLLLLAGAGFGFSDGRVELSYSNYGPLTWNGQYWRLLTAAFVHFGVFHLAFNMYALYSGGAWTEKLYGSARFAIIYLLAALSGSVVSGWWDSSRNSAGASGAVFGVYGALLVFVLRRPDDIPRDLLKAVRGGAISLCAYSLAMGVASRFVDNAAHVGGLLGGALAGFLLLRPFDPAARARPQPWRIAAVVVGICAVLALLAPKPVNEAMLDDQTAEIVAQHSRLFTQFRALVGDVDSGRLAAPVAAARIRREILDPWESASRPLNAASIDGARTARQAQWRAAYQEYSRNMQQAIALTARRMEMTEAGQELEETTRAAAEAMQRAAAAASRIEDLSRLGPGADGGTSGGQ